MDELTADAEAKQAVLGSLATLYPWMRPYYSRPVRDYASRLFEAPLRKAEPEIRRRALTKLLDTIRNAGKRNGLPVKAVSQICSELEERRVLQTGPHLFLLWEPEAYYTHILSLLGLSAHGCSSYVSYAVSTVSLVEKPRRGPGWLTVDGKPINVFGLSRSRMIGYSLLTGPGSYRFELVPTEPNAEGDALAQLRSLLPKTPFERPAHAIKAANLMLWPKLFGGNVAFLQIDDEDIADLMADHLSDDDSWLRTRLLEHPTLASNILTGLDRLAAGPWSGWLARGTDFFWFYEKGKRLPLRLISGDLVHPATGIKVARFMASDIIERLANRSLIPNLLMMFLVLSILPGVRALGGSYQPLYYPLMRYVVCQALETAGVDEDLRQALAPDDMPGAWGHRVIECDEDPFQQFLDGRNGGTSSLIDRIGDIPFAKACGRHEQLRDGPNVAGPSQPAATRDDRADRCGMDFCLNKHARHFAEKKAGATYVQSLSGPPPATTHAVQSSARRSAAGRRGHRPGLCPGGGPSGWCVTPQHAVRRSDTDRRCRRAVSADDQEIGG